MKKIITFIISIFLVSILVAQSPRNFKAVEIKDFNETFYGFKDENNNCIIEPVFEQAIDFTEGLGAVEFVSGGYGYIDATGKIIIENRNCKVGQLYPFSEGLALVQCWDSEAGAWKLGYIDKKGNKVTGQIYDGGKNFNKGLAIIYLYPTKSYGLIDKKGKEVLPIKYQDIIVVSENIFNVKFNEKWTVIDRQGKEFDFSIPYYYSESDGLIPVELNNKIGYMDDFGKVIIPFKFTTGYGFSEEMAFVKYNLKNDSNFVIDKTGKELFKVPYNYIDKFNRGISKVDKPKSNYSYHQVYNFINTNGKEIFKQDFYESNNSGEGKYNLNNNLIIVNTGTEPKYYQYGCIDRKGNEIIKIKYSNIGTNIGVNFTKVALSKNSGDERWGYIDSVGNEIIETKYSRIEQFFNGYAVAKSKNGTGVIDMKGTEIIPMKYELIQRYPNNFYVASLGKYDELLNIKNQRLNKEDYSSIRYTGVNNLFCFRAAANNKFGIIDGDGNILVAPKFEKIVGKYNNEKYNQFNDYTYFLGIIDLDSFWNQKYALIGINGKQLTEPIYSYIDRNSKEEVVHVFTEKGKQRYGLLNVNTGVKIKNSFHEYGSYYNGVMKVGDSSLFGVIDKSGNYIIPQKYKEADIDFMSEGLIALNKNGKYCYLDVLGKTVISPQFQKAFNFKMGVALVQLNNKWHYINKTGKIVSTKQYEDIYGDYNTNWHFYAVMGKDVIEGRLQDGKFVEVKKEIVPNNINEDIKVITTTKEEAPQVKFIIDADKEARKEVPWYNKNLRIVIDCYKYQKPNNCNDKVLVLRQSLALLFRYANEKLYWAEKMTVEERKASFGQDVLPAFKGQLTDLQKHSTDLDNALRQPSLLDLLLASFEGRFGK
jgi:WG containing repeat